ncbi:MAG TPA: efflux RND transporter periplasmic adaptor subunit [Gemmatimonadaceae bacterium]|nr:efflux RND transporter periplasmic adaptor subunit [Gemmatimonadaceae bacterium]
MTGRFSFVAAALVATTACVAHKPASTDAIANAPVLVRTAPVRVNPAAAERVQATGTLGPKDELRLSFEIGGVVGRLLVHEGEQVQAGQPLATLDSTEIHAQVAKAQSVAEQADQNQARIRNLYGDSVATLSQLEAANTAASVAHSDLQVAQFNRKYATVVAPASGTVLHRLVEQGEVVSPGEPVLVIGSSDSGKVVRVGLADRDAVRVRVGDAAAVRFSAYPGETFAGRVSEIAPSASKGSGAYDVQVRLDGGRPLASGLIGAVDIVPSRTESLRVIPIEALIEGDGDRASVFALAADGKTVQRKPITVAFIRDSLVTVREGLAGVNTVVTEGAAYLTDGAVVKVVTTAPPKTLP